ncbi:MAG: hypothetical protein IJK54_10580 [Clostridia bacterium]|jgi:hypothetical protein|nr:hypothetical protein [Clostridia bacterium]
MLLFFGMQLVPLAYGVLYLMHSFKTRRTGQALATLTLIVLLLTLLSVLAWEFFTAP